MAKTKETKRLEQLIYHRIHKTGTFCCFEVTIGFYGKERVDMLSMDTKGVFRCFEIKVSESDFRSTATKSFVGHFNYFVLTQELYDKVKDEIPSDIGVYVGSVNVKKAKKKEVTDEMCQTLKDSMIRSLHRYLEDYLKQGEDTEYRKLKANLSSARSQSKKYYKNWREAEGLLLKNGIRVDKQETRGRKS